LNTLIGKAAGLAAGFDPARSMRPLEALDATRDKESFALDEWLSTLKKRDDWQ